jgi:D,D-heptose 1,7-bisphosphate phosphatase
VTKTVFLDRDGTINEDVNFLRRPEDVRILPQVGRGMAMLQDCGFRLVVVSNQSGLARGILNEYDLFSVQQEIRRQLSVFSVSLDGAYFCPHHPTRGVVEDLVKTCSCRKPQPGLIYMAAEEMSLDLHQSFMIGDRLRDIACGQAAGLPSILVTTGRYQDDGPLRSWPNRPDYVAADFWEAARWIALRSGKREVNESIDS